MKFIILSLFLIFFATGCNATGEYFAGTSTEVASCFKAEGSSTFMGQQSATAAGCKCQISPSAGLRVTEAAVSSDGSQCYMKVAADAPVALITE